MKLKYLILFMVCSLTSIVGCSTAGFHREELMSAASVEKPQFDDKEIQKAYAKKSNLPKPFKLAVYFKQPKSARGRDQSWRWSEDDRKIFSNLEEHFKNSKIVSKIIPVATTVVEEDSLRGIRLAAAKYQADAILVISGAGEVQRGNNGWMITYIALVPALFVKGSEAESMFIASATLWDVKNEVLYLSAESEAVVKETTTAAAAKTDQELLDASRGKAVAQLQSEILKQISGTQLK